MRQIAFALAASSLIAGCTSDDGPCDPDAPGTICTIVGNGEKVNAPDVADPLEAGLDEPQDMLTAPDGTLWVIDFNFYKIRSLGSDGKLRRVMGSIFGDSPRSESQPATPALLAKFNHFPTMTLHDGDVYIAAWHNRDVKKLDLETMMVTDIAGTSTAEAYYGDGGPAIMAGADLPSGIAFDPQGRLVWMDQANQVIRRINLDGNVERIGGQCIAGENVTPCAAGEVPQACPGSNKTVCGGNMALCQDFCTPGFAGDGGLAIDARFAQAFGQSTDPGGRLAYRGADLFLADRDNNRIRKIDANGIITTIAGTGDIGYSGDGGLATEAKLNHPVDLEFAPDGTLYFTDVGNNCVRKIDPAGVISTVVGRCTVTNAPATGDFGGDGGPAKDALLNWPYGIHLSGNKLYVADSYNHRIRVVNL